MIQLHNCFLDFVGRCWVCLLAHVFHASYILKNGMNTEVLPSHFHGDTWLYVNDDIEQEPG